MDDDQDFEALLEQSSLRSKGARRLSERTPAGRADDVRRIIELLSNIDHPVGAPTQNVTQQMAALARSINNPEWLYRVAVEAGHEDVLIDMAWLRAVAGDNEGAQAFYEAAVKAGHNDVVEHEEELARQIQASKIKFYLYFLEHGGASAMILQLARHPEDVSLVLRNLRPDQLGAVQNSLQLMQQEPADYPQDSTDLNAQRQLAAILAKEEGD
ncbi:hypothetical protein AB0F92_20575 [Kitasatospora aureofaciens]|uniref:hypothetical protein n=1 Tax=Kitasatospora aureofaciens TaxID=1894 RepID=UPI0033DCA6C3